MAATGIRSLFSRREPANASAAISTVPVNIAIPMSGSTHQSGCAAGWKVSMMLENIRQGRNTIRVTSDIPLTTSGPTSLRAAMIHPAATMMATWEMTRNVSVKTLRKVSATERVQSGDRLAEDERMDVVGAFVGVDALQIGEMPHRLVLGENAVGTQQPPRF